MAPPRVLVMGVGNPLVKDEGIGVRVVEELEKAYRFPENVSLVDAGTMGMSILNLFQQADYVLVVDAVDGSGEPPGTVLRLSPEDAAPNQVKHSLHDIRMVDVLDAAELTGMRPEAEFVGIQVKRLGPIEMGLTPEVEAAVPRAVEAVLEVLAERGFPGVPA